MGGTFLQGGKKFAVQISLLLNFPSYLRFSFTGDKKEDLDCLYLKHPTNKQSKNFISCNCRAFFKDIASYTALEVSNSVTRTCQMSKKVNMFRNFQYLGH